MRSKPARKHRDRSASKATRGFSALEWTALAVIAAGAVYLLIGPVVAGPSRGEALLASLEIETTETGQEAVRLDYGTWRQACENAGLPDPCDLDGADPVPVRILLTAFDRWVRTGDPGALGTLGHVYQALEEHAAAIQCFAAAAEMLPDDPQWRYHLGVEAQALGLDDLALQALTRAAADDPDYPTTHARIGLLHLERQELDEAETAYRRVVALQPERSLGHVGLGRVALARRALPEAEQHLRRAVAKTPNDFLAHRLLARALAGNDREEEARAAARLAERLPRYQGWLANDDRLQASHAMADSQRHLTNEMRLAAAGNDWARIVAVTEELLKRRPDDASLIANLAGVYRKLGRHDDAERIVKRALRRHPDEVPLHSVLAEIALARGDYRGVHRAIRRALELDDTRARSYDLLGRALFLEGRTDEAITVVRKAVALAPDVPETRLALGEMLRKTGAYDEATEAVRKILEDDPDHAQAKRMLEAIRMTRDAAARNPGQSPVSPQ